MTKNKEKLTIIIAGCIIGVISSLLVFFGNPANMGFCIACFLRDIAGGVGLHRAAAVQYIRPEIIGLVLGSFAVALAKKEFSAKGGSSPITRFMLGFFVMIGCLMFLGCPFRMILRMAGGDLNALFGLAGFVAGILAGVFFLNKGYSLKRTYKLPSSDGVMLPVIMGSLLVLLAIAPAFHLLYRSRRRPWRKTCSNRNQPCSRTYCSAIAQRTRLCMVGGIVIWCFSVNLSCSSASSPYSQERLYDNLILTAATAGTYFNLGMAGQPVAHSRSFLELLRHVPYRLRLHTSRRMSAASACSLR